LIALSFDAPQVVMHRLAQLSRAGLVPTSRDGLELQRMSAEKLEAAWESWAAMIATTITLSQNAWLGLWLRPNAPWTLASCTMQAYRAWVALAVSGLLPIQRRARANARRLSSTG